MQDLDDTIARLNAYSAAGADVVYAPGLASPEQVRAVLNEVDKPLNVLFASVPDVSMAQYAQLGVRRISLGGALANHAFGATLLAAKEILKAGTFGWVVNAASGKTIRQLLG